MKTNATHSSTGPSRSSPGPRPPRPPRPGKPQPAPGAKHPVRLRHDESAGGIIFRVRDGAREFFFLRHGKGKWTFPKGHQEMGETLVQTAVREIKEEAGLVGLTFLSPVGRTSFRFRKEGELIHKTVHFFLFQAPHDAEAKLTGEEAIWDAVWVPESQIFKTVGYQNLKKLLARSQRILAKRERKS